MGVHAGRIELEPGDRTRLEEMSRSRTLPARLVLRAKILLMRSEGAAFRVIGEALGCGPATVVRWCERWDAAGFKGIEEERLVGVDGCSLMVEDVDMLDGTPILDIKPFYPKLV